MANWKIEVCVLVSIVLLVTPGFSKASELKHTAYKEESKVELKGPADSFGRVTNSLGSRGSYDPLDSDSLDYLGSRGSLGSMDSIISSGPRTSSSTRFSVGSKKSKGNLMDSDSLDEMLMDLEGTKDRLPPPIQRVNLEKFELKKRPGVNRDVGSDWTYERLRDAVAHLNNGFFEYADRLSSRIKYNFMIRSKFLVCNAKVGDKEQEKRHSIQDKINLQEALEDLQTKYDTLEQALEKLEDINEDNHESITRLRAHRDRCVQSNASRRKTIDSLRDEATELRRQITQARAKLASSR